MTDHLFAAALRLSDNRNKLNHVRPPRVEEPSLLCLSSLCSAGQADLGPAVLSVCSGLGEPELHRSGSEEVHLRVADQTADTR